MRRMRVAVIGSGTLSENVILPFLSTPSALSAPDEGAWWLRRPNAQIDIAYQVPARPEIVALCDDNAPRLERVARAMRIPRICDWTTLCSEMASGIIGVDALIVATSPARTERLLSDLGARKLENCARWIWLAGPPATNFQRAREAAKLHAARVIWCARPASQMLAHRAARRLHASGEIGPLRALALRWPHSMPSENSHDVAAIYAALELVLTFLAPDLGRDVAHGAHDNLASVVRRIAASTCDGVSNVWIENRDGSSATILLNSADDWNADLPRLEICGSQGRSLLCRGGREVQIFEPREATRTISPPGATARLFNAQILGLSEELNAFFALWARNETQAPRHDGSTLNRASAVLELWHALSCALRNQAPFEFAAAPDLALDVTINREETLMAAEPVTLTLPFN